MVNFLLALVFLLGSASVMWWERRRNSRRLRGRR